MAAYPTAPAFKSETVPTTNTKFRRTESGRPRGANLVAVHAYEIKVEHPAITTAEKATLQAWFDTNANSDNTITASDGYAYDCWVMGPYAYRLWEGSSTMFVATMTLKANRQ